MTTPKKIGLELQVNGGYRLGSRFVMIYQGNGAARILAGIDD